MKLSLFYLMLLLHIGRVGNLYIMGISIMDLNQSITRVYISMYEDVVVCTLFLNIS